MGYECPVCATEEADGEHLANHLAFTALVRGGDHEDWLDERVPDWADRDPDSLAPEVTPHATETDTEPVTEVHDHDVPAVERTGGTDPARRTDHAGETDADISGDAADVLAEARALTEQMYEDANEEPEESEASSGSEESEASPKSEDPGESPEPDESGESPESEGLEESSGSETSPDSESE